MLLKSGGNFLYAPCFCPDSGNALLIRLNTGPLHASGKPPYSGVFISPTGASTPRGNVYLLRLGTLIKVLSRWHNRVASPRSCP